MAHTTITIMTMGMTVTRMTTMVTIMGTGIATACRVATATRARSNGIGIVGG